MDGPGGGGVGRRALFYWLAIKLGFRAFRKGFLVGAMGSSGLAPANGRMLSSHELTHSRAARRSAAHVHFPSPFELLQI